MSNPILAFMRIRANQPMIGALEAAVARGGAHNGERLFTRMRMDGWRSFSAAVSRSNSKAFYTYLARAEGRRQWGLVPADSAPLLLGDEVIIGSRRKCEVIAGALCARLEAPAVSHPDTQHRSPDDGVLGRFTERLEGGHAQARPGEIRRGLSPTVSRRRKTRSSPQLCERARTWWI